MRQKRSGLKLTGSLIGRIVLPVYALSKEDRRAIDRGVATLASADDSGSLPERCLSALAAAVDADLFSYNDVNLDTGEARFVLKPGRTATAGSSQFLRRFGYHPAALSAFHPAPGAPLPRFVADPRLRALGVGNCCGDAEIKLNAGLDLSERGARRVGIGVSRAVRDFDERDGAILGALRPFLAEALRRTATAMEPPTGAADFAGRRRLTRRENEVLYWVAMGKTNDEIASIVGARPLTVKKHLEHVYEKLDVPNRTAAAAAARGGGGAAMLVLPPTRA